MPRALARAWAANRPLTLVGAALLAVLAGTVVGLVVDPRVITGAPAWLKPAKFAISMAIYSFTMIWLLTFVQGRERLVTVVSWITAVGFAIEMALIGGAAAVGTTSHFNVSTPLQATIWSTMGSAIVAVWVAGLFVAIALLRQRMADAAFAWSLRLGVLVSLVGMALAFFMTGPTSEQLAKAQAGGGMTTVGAHSVGVADGGPGLPIVGWSTEGGDLRVSHFIGLHAMQLLPLLGWALARWAPRFLRPVDRTALVITAGSSYLSIVVLTAWQALRGQSLVRPDALTLGVLAAVLVATVSGMAVIVIRARRAALLPTAVAA